MVSSRMQPFWSLVDCLSSENPNLSLAKAVKEIGEMYKQ